MLENPEFITDEKARICLSLAFFGVALDEKEDVISKGELPELYCLMDLTRKLVIGYYTELHRQRKGNPVENIKYVHLVCEYWIRVFRQYGSYFSDKNPQTEIWRILDGNFEEKTPDWTNLELYSFWYEERTNLRFRLSEMLKELRVWYGEGCYNLDARNSLAAAMSRKAGSSKRATTTGTPRLGRYWHVFVWVWITMCILSGALISGWMLNLMLSATFIGLAIFAICFVIRLMKGRYRSGRMFPRLLGCIVIGYIPLIITEDVWKFCLNISRLTWLQVIFLGLFASFFYIFMEVKNAVDYRKRALKTALRLTSVGVAQSMAIGLVLCSLFNRITRGIDTSANFIGNLPREILVPVLFGSPFGLKHFVYPSVLLTYFSLALFIGIFVQILWEDKPITAEV